MKIFLNLLLLFFCVNVYANRPIDTQGLHSNNLPNVLSKKDIILYKKIINSQNNGNWEIANKHTALVNNNILMGYVEYEKLMHPNKYRATYEELKRWLQKYNDHPVVLKKRIYNLMLKRASNQRERSALKKPKFENYIRGYGENRPIKYSSKFKTKNFNNTEFNNDILASLLRQDYERLIDLEKIDIKKFYYGISLAKNIADKSFYSGQLKKSYQIYESLISKVGVEDADIYFKAGINAYRLNKKVASKNYFIKCNKYHENQNSLDAWHYSGCLFWKSKTEKFNSNNALIKAASFPRTFYGQLALERLKIKGPFNWKVNKLDFNSQNYDDLMKFASFKRLIALANLNFYNYADLEIRNLYTKIEKHQKTRLFYLSEKLNLAAVLMRLGSTYENIDQSLYLRGLYPTPQWKIKSGYILDRALLYALIRRESAFNFKAKSSKGARGLMQLMPRTASKLKNDYSLRYGNAYQLYSLDLNLSLGQKFLKSLIKGPQTGNSLLKTLIAYNAGIVRLRDWDVRFYKQNDPILYIESIPIKETRQFVKYIFADMWIYRDRLKQEKPTRKMLSEGKWPFYKNIDYFLIKDARI